MQVVRGGSGGCSHGTEEAQWGRTSSQPALHLGRGSQHPSRATCWHHGSPEHRQGPSTHCARGSTVSPGQGRWHRQHRSRTARCRRGAAEPCRNRSRREGLQCGNGGSAPDSSPHRFSKLPQPDVCSCRHAEQWGRLSHGVSRALSLGWAHCPPGTCPAELPAPCTSSIPAQKRSPNPSPASHRAAPKALILPASHRPSSPPHPSAALSLRANSGGDTEAERLAHPNHHLHVQTSFSRRCQLLCHRDGAQPRPADVAIQE